MNSTRRWYIVGAILLSLVMLSVPFTSMQYGVTHHNSSNNKADYSSFYSSDYTSGTNPDLTITVENYNGTLASTMSGVTTVYLYNSSGYLANEQINSNSQVFFYNIPEGFYSGDYYYIYVFHQPDEGLNFEEYWGTMVTKAYTSPFGGYQDTSYTFVRNMLIQYKTTASVSGNQVSVSVTMYNTNASSSPISAYAEVFLSTTMATDTSQTISEDTYAINIPGHSYETEPVTFQDVSPGTYFIYVVVYGYHSYSLYPVTSSDLSPMDQITWESYPTVTVNSPEVSVTFEAETSGTISYSFSPYGGDSGGSGTALPSGETISVPQGDTLVLDANPDPGYTFSSWTGSVTGSQNPDSDIVSGVQTLGAKFTQEASELTLNSGSGGTIDYEYTDNGQTETGTVQSGSSNILNIPDSTSVTLTANPDSGYLFSGWGGSISGTQNPETFDVISSETISASFVQDLTITISPSSESITTGTALTFNAYTTGGTGGNQFTWYINGISVYEGSSSTYYHTFSSEGTYNVQVTVSDSSGAIAKSNIVTITVNAPSLSVSITPMSETISAGDSLTFISSVNGGTGSYQYKWYLDGNMQSGESSSSFSYNFNTPGTFSVYLSVTDSAGVSAISNTANIVVESASPLAIQISAPTTSTYAGNSITFTANPSGGSPPYSFSWYINGVKEAGYDSSTFNFLFSSTGTFQVYAVVTDNTGATAVSNTISVTVASSFGSLAVDVSAKNGTAINGANVEISTSSSFISSIATSTSDSEGQALFQNLPVGFYYVKVSRDDYNTTTETVTVVSGSQASLLVVMNASEFTITIEASTGGSITYALDSISGNIGSGQSKILTLLYGTTLVLTASASAGYQFTGWSGDISGTENPYTLDVQGNVEIQATFSTSTYDISFIEKGLIVGNNWSIDLNGVNQTATSPNSIIFTSIREGTYQFTAYSQYYSYTGVTEIDITSDKSQTILFTPLYNIVETGYSVSQSGVLPRDDEGFTVTLSMENLGASSYEIPSNLQTQMNIPYMPGGKQIVPSIIPVAGESLTLSPQSKEQFSYQVNVGWQVALPESASQFLSSALEGLAIHAVEQVISAGTSQFISYAKYNYFDNGLSQAWPSVSSMLSNVAEWGGNVLELSTTMMGFLKLISNIEDLVLSDNLTIILPAGVHTADKINATVYAPENKIELTFDDVAAYMAANIASSVLSAAALATLPLATTAVGAIIPGVLTALAVLVKPVTQAIMTKEISDPTPDYSTFASIQAPSESILSISNQSLRELSLHLYYYNAYLNASTISNTRGYEAKIEGNIQMEFLQDSYAKKYSLLASQNYSILKSELENLISSINQSGLVTLKNFSDGKNLTKNRNVMDQLGSFLANFGYSGYVNSSFFSNVTYAVFNQNETTNLSLNFIDLASDITNNSDMLLTSSGYAIPSSLGIITFIEHGLPENQTWNVSINGQVYEGNNSSIEVSIPQGRFSFLAYSYITFDTESGNSYSEGGNASFVSVDFTAAKMYTIKLIPSGIGNLTWGLSIGNFMVNRSAFRISGFYQLELPNGTYDLNILSPNGYQYNGTVHNITVNGINLSTVLTFQKVRPKQNKIILEIALVVVLFTGVVGILVYYYRRR